MYLKNRVDVGGLSLQTLHNVSIVKRKKTEMCHPPSSRCLPLGCGSLRSHPLYPQTHRPHFSTLLRWHPIPYTNRCPTLYAVHEGEDPRNGATGTFYPSYRGSNLSRTSSRVQLINTNLHPSQAESCHFSKSLALETCWFYCATTRTCLELLGHGNLSR